MRLAWLRSPEADTLLLLRRHVLRWNLGLHRHAGRRLGPLKLGVARRLPGLPLLGFDEPLADLAQTPVVAAAARPAERRPRPAGRRRGPRKRGGARRRPGRHLLGVDEPRAERAQPPGGAAAA